MKILSAQQIQQWDAYTIANEPISSVDLMERAAQTCTEYILQREMFDRHFKIFCGKEIMVVMASPLQGNYKTGIIP